MPEFYIAQPIGHLQKQAGQVVIGADVQQGQKGIRQVGWIQPAKTQYRSKNHNSLREFEHRHASQRLQTRAVLVAWERRRCWRRVHGYCFAPLRTLARSSSTISSAALRASPCWFTSKEIAPTR